MSKVTIVDSICGKGKTSWAIQYMDENVDKRFIYITPFLDEVERVIDGCSNRYFCQPKIYKGNGSKLEHFNNLISQGKNIVSTHALFSLVNKDTLRYLEENEYTLILDEVFSVIEEINIKKSDREMLLETKKIKIELDGKVLWLDNEYNGNMNEYKKSIQNGDVYMVNGVFLLWTFPTSILKSIEESYVLTYMFKGQIQRYYYDMNNISYEYKSVEAYEKEILLNGEVKTITKYKLLKYNPNENLIHIKNLINICTNERLNSIGISNDGRSNPLSKSWYDNQNKKKLDGLDILKLNMENYFKNICKSSSDLNAWTTFKDYKNKCKGKGYSKGFISCNARATNNYRHKKSLAYCVNIFNNPKIIKFFISKGVNVDEDTFALSELVQWIFRSQLRDGGEVNIYIPSERMRNLLYKWLN